MKRKRFISVLSCILIFSSVTILNASSKTPNQSTRRPLDIVFCVDLSGSTNGVINDLRDQMWLIINQTQKLQPAPELRISFVGFSRPSFGKNTGYVKIFSDLTNNFDNVAARMNTLKPSIEKGDQIVTAAISNCVTELNWSKNPDAVKIIFLIGNGMVSGPEYEYVKPCEEAASRKIIINTIYVQRMNNMIKELPGWRRIASMTGGLQSELTVNKKDDISVEWKADLTTIKKLHQQLDASYMWKGRDATECQKNQFSADSGALAAGKNVYFNRVYQQISEEYPYEIKPCELVSEYIVNSNTPADSALSEFDSRLKDQKILRDKIVEALRLKLSDEPIMTYGDLYRKSKLPDNNIFERVVLNMLFSQWR